MSALMGTCAWIWGRAAFISKVYLPSLAPSLPMKARRPLGNCLLCSPLPWLASSCLGLLKPPVVSPLPQAAGAWLFFPIKGHWPQKEIKQGSDTEINLIWGLFSLTSNKGTPLLFKSRTVAPILKIILKCPRFHILWNCFIKALYGCEEFFSFIGIAHPTRAWEDLVRGERDSEESLWW